MILCYDINLQLLPLLLHLLHKHLIRQDIRLVRTSIPYRFFLLKLALRCQLLILTIYLLLLIFLCVHLNECKLGALGFCEHNRLGRRDF